MMILIWLPLYILDILAQSKICSKIKPNMEWLPPDPRVPTADLPRMFNPASLAAAGLLAGVVLAFLTGGRRR